MESVLESNQLDMETVLEISQIEKEEKYLHVVKWHDVACYSMQKPLRMPSDLNVFEMDNRSDEIAVVQRNGSFKYMNTVDRAIELLKLGFVIREKGLLFGKRKVLTKILHDTDMDRTFEQEHIQRIKNLYNVRFFTKEQAIERLLPFMKTEDASMSYLGAE